MRAFPNAKVILTVRDDAEGWHKSVRSTIFAGMTMGKGLTMKTFHKLFGLKRRMGVAEMTCRHPPPGYEKGKQFLTHISEWKTVPLE